MGSRLISHGRGVSVVSLVELVELVREGGEPCFPFRNPTVWPQYQYHSHANTLTHTHIQYTVRTHPQRPHLVSLSSFSEFRSGTSGRGGRGGWSRWCGWGWMLEQYHYYNTMYSTLTTSCTHTYSKRREPRYRHRKIPMVTLGRQVQYSNSSVDRLLTTVTSPRVLPSFLLSFFLSLAKPLMLINYHSDLPPTLPFSLLLYHRKCRITRSSLISNSAIRST